MRRSWSAAALVIGVVVLGHAPAAHAQIVNIQGALAKPPPNNGTIVNITSTLDWRTGNNPIIDVAGGASVLWRHDRILALAIARGEYGDDNGVTLTEKTFEHLRARITIDCRWRWEAFVQHTYDEFQRLSIRMTAGTGPAFQLVDTKNYAALLGASYMVEYEEIGFTAGADDSNRRAFDQRASVYLTGHAQVQTDIGIDETFYAQPRFSDGRDIRLLSEAAVTSKLTKHVALTDSLVIAYDSSPPDLVKKLDTELKLGVIIQF